MQVNNIIAALIGIARSSHEAMHVGTANEDGSFTIPFKEAKTLAAMLHVLNDIPQPVDGESLTGPGRAAEALESFVTGTVLSIDIDLDADLLDGVLSAAIEDVIDYWAQDYEAENKNGQAFSIAIHEDDGEGEGRRLVANKENVTKAISRLIQEKDLCRADIRSAITSAILENDAGYIDAEAADVIIQVAVLGSIVYG